MVEDLEIKTSTKLGDPWISGIRRQTKRRIVIDIRTDLREVRMIQHIEEACLERETILFCEAEALDGCNVHICIARPIECVPLYRNIAPKTIIDVTRAGVCAPRTRPNVSIGWTDAVIDGTALGAGTGIDSSFVTTSSILVWIVATRSVFHC